MEATINHSRLDREHFKNCKPCYDDHYDLMQDCHDDGGSDE